jgi:hypothetical protein
VVLDPKTDVSGTQLDKEIVKMREEEDSKFFNGVSRLYALIGLPSL